MQTIEKNPQLAVNFINWVKINQKAIDEGKKSFEDITDDAKKSLKNSLIQEQKYICCFCGQRIEQDENWAEIAHFEPQRKAPDKIFKYDNLFASCNGGANYRKYQIRKDISAKELMDTFNDNIYRHLGDDFGSIQSIDNQKVIYYKLSNGKKEKYRPKKIDTYQSIIDDLKAKHNSNFQEHILYRKKVMIQEIKPSEILKEGSYVFVGKPYENSEYHHCNNAQKETELHFSFFDENLLSYFWYDEEGKMFLTDTNFDLKNDISETLNLNNPYLCFKRAKIINFFYTAYNEGLLETIEDIIYSDVDKSRLNEFSFVYISEFKRLS